MPTSSKGKEAARAFSALKVLSHLDKIQEMRRGTLVAPVTVELDPTNICNHNCIWCLDQQFRDRCRDTLPWETALSLIQEFAAMGVNAVVVKGSGEPTIVPHFARLLYALRDAGLKAAVTTNGSLLSDERAQALAECCDWVRVSVDAATRETHDAIHRPARRGDFDQIIRNMQQLAALRDRRHSSLVIGYKFSADEHNYQEIVAATRLARDIGADNISLRAVDLACHGFDDKAFRAIQDEIVNGMVQAKQLGTDDFLVLVGGIRSPAAIHSCPAADLVGIISANGNVYACLDLKGREEYAMGNVYNGGFRSIWFGERRKEVRQKLNRLECRRHCSLKYDGYNEVLEAALGACDIHAEFL